MRGQHACDFAPLIGGLTLAWLIRAQHAQQLYQSKTWQGWVIGGIAGFLALLIVFLIGEWGRSDNYEPDAAFLWAFYVIEFIFFGGAAGAWTHRQVSRKLLEDSFDKLG